MLLWTALRFSAGTDLQEPSPLRFCATLIEALTTRTEYHKQNCSSDDQYTAMAGVLEHPLGTWTPLQSSIATSHCTLKPAVVSVASLARMFTFGIDILYYQASLFVNDEVGL